MENFNFGENLRQIRVQKGISQEAMALKMDITQTKYSRMERSECVPAKIYVDRAAKFLEVPALELLPPGWDYSKTLIIFRPSLGKAAIIAYRVLLAVAFFDMARGFCDGARITATPSKIAAVIGFEGLAVAFMYYTEKPLVNKIRSFLRFISG
ncbi:helix-turn-helix transcriptional regulator [Daejeonella sp.]|uniref:helix-turn-helix domain-containing protein n=1 Tax=Daejeonella sp. TaxID=2805397 RepID=UPI0030BC3842